MMLNASSAANVVMLGAGYFNPLEGFMGLSEALKCAEKMQAKNGLFWPIPIINVCKDISAIKNTKRVSLLDPNTDDNRAIAIMEIENIESVAHQFVIIRLVPGCPSKFLDSRLLGDVNPNLWH